MDHFFSSQTDRYSPASLCKLSQQARLLRFEDAAQLLCVCVSEVNSYCVKNNMSNTFSSLSEFHWFLLKLLSVSFF